CPRPAVCSRATTTRPSLAGSSARAAAYVFVLSRRSNTIVCRPRRRVGNSHVSEGFADEFIGQHPAPSVILGRTGRDHGKGNAYQPEPVARTRQPTALTVSKRKEAVRSERPSQD